MLVPQPITILLVDDQVLFREALRVVLNQDPAISVVAEADHGAQAIKLVEKLQPQVVLMDLHMPVMSGTEATRRIRMAHAAVKVLVLSSLDDDTEIFAALNAGAAGYLLKNAASTELIRALKTVAAGQSYLQPSVTSQVVAEFSRLSQFPFAQAEHPSAYQLSEQDCHVLRLLTRSLSNKEIATELCLTEGTIKNQMSHIFDKLNVPDRTAAALKALKIRLDQPGT